MFLHELSNSVFYLTLINDCVFFIQEDSIVIEGWSEVMIIDSTLKVIDLVSFYYPYLLHVSPRNWLEIVDAVN